MNASSASTPLSYAEEVLRLRCRIMDHLAQKAFLSPAYRQQVAVYLNLCTDVDTLLEMEQEVLQAQQESDITALLLRLPLGASEAHPFSPLMPRREGSSREAPLPSMKALRALLALPEGPELKPYLERTLLLMGEGCMLFSLGHERAILERAARLACRLVYGDWAVAVILEEGRVSSEGRCGAVPAALPEQWLSPARTGRPWLHPWATVSPVQPARSNKASVTSPPENASLPRVDMVSVPIQGPTENKGVLAVGWAHPKTLHEEDLRILKAFAAQTTFALENLTLHEQVRLLERLRERQRIAQELHDTVIQLLFVIGMEAQELARRDPTAVDVQQAATRIRRLAARAAAELRSAIVALAGKPRTGAVTLSALLQDAVEEFERWSHIEVTLVEPRTWPDLSPQVAQAVYRIVREALTNVQKHAQATAVVVSVAVRPDRLVVSVQDNGIGLPANFATGANALHFGLSSMHRLAEEVGGYLEVLDGEEGGTMVRLILPLPLHLA